MEFNQKIKLAELTGIILGDGNLHKRSNCITIVGSLEDIYYYNTCVIPLFEELFKIRPKLRERNDRNAYYLHLENKKVFEILIKEADLIRGDKTNARIPQFILKNKEMVPHFLRGLFDTDGCLKFSKQTKNKNYYPRIQFCFKDTLYTRELGYLIDKLGIKYGFWKEKRKGGFRLVYYHISGKNNLEKWMKIIGMNNMVHKSKYLFWKKFGYYSPKSSLKHRLNALNLNINDIY